MKALILTMLLGSVPRLYPVHVEKCSRPDACQAVVFLGFDVAKAKANLRLCDIEAYPHDKKHGDTARKAGERLDLIIRSARTVWVMVPQKLKCFGPICDLKDDAGNVMVYLFVDGVIVNEYLVKEGLVASKPKQCEYMQTSLKL